MFTGIVETTGTVVAIQQGGAGARIRIEATGWDASDIKLGDSIAVSGVCLTVVELDTRGFAADLSAETLACTTLGGLAASDAVNLEKALKFSDRLGGHLVSGHVDGVGQLLKTQGVGNAQAWTIAADAALLRYVAAKGSICVDGVSLTVNALGDKSFELMLIPHTLAVTTLGRCLPGTALNLEVDLVSRYVERLLASGMERGESGMGSRE